MYKQCVFVVFLVHDQSEVAYAEKEPRLWCVKLRLGNPSVR